MAYLEEILHSFLVVGVTSLYTVVIHRFVVDSVEAEQLLKKDVMVDTVSCIVETRHPFSYFPATSKQKKILPPHCFLSITVKTI